MYDFIVVMAGSEAPDSQAQLHRHSDVAQTVTALTEQWVQDFQAASGERAQAESEAFSLDGASTLPAHIARLTLRATPQVYTLRPYSDVPYANTEERYSDASHLFATPRELSGKQRHVPSYEQKPQGFLSPDAMKRGWSLPPKDYHAALLLSEHQTGTNESALLVIHLAGASAVGGAVEKPE